MRQRPMQAATAGRARVPMTRSEAAMANCARALAGATHALKVADAALEGIEREEARSLRRQIARALASVELLLDAARHR